MKKEVSIFWFRRDLRLFDNNALFNALTSKYPVLPIFIFDPDILDKLSDKKDKRVEFIRQTLEQLNNILKPTGSSIYVLHEMVTKAFDKLTEEYSVKEVYVNHDYEPYAINRDLTIKALLEAKNIAFKTFKDQMEREVLSANSKQFSI
jgi:deoxyribodipyrimidine photo-lyase